MKKCHSILNAFLRSFSVLIGEFLIAFEASKTTDAIEFGYRYFENLRYVSHIFPAARIFLRHVDHANIDFTMKNYLNSYDETRNDNIPD